MSDSDGFRYSDYEYKRYASDDYRDYKRAAYICALIPIVLFILIFVSGGGNPEHIGGGLVIASILGMPGIIFINFQKKELDDKVAAAIDFEKRQTSSDVKIVREEIINMRSSIEATKLAGHTVMTGNGSIVIIGSNITNSFNKIQKDDPLLADALSTIAGAVERSGNKDAGLAWARFLKELAGDKDPIVMRSLWDRVISLAPNVTSLAESVSKIAGLFV